MRHAKFYHFDFTLLYISFDKPIHSYCNSQLLLHVFWSVNFTKGEWNNTAKNLPIIPSHHTHQYRDKVFTKVCLWSYSQERCCKVLTSTRSIWAVKGGRLRRLTCICSCIYQWQPCTQWHKIPTQSGTLLHFGQRSDALTFLSTFWWPHQREMYASTAPQRCPREATNQHTGTNSKAHNRNASLHIPFKWMAR